MKHFLTPLIVGLSLLGSPPVRAQHVVNTLTDFGLRRQALLFEGDTVQFVVLARPGDEQRPKPVFLWVQGSMPKPLALYDDKGRFGIVPFNPKKLLERYHLVVIGKPGIPLLAHRRSLGPGDTYVDEQGRPPAEYCRHNLLSYYVRRNIAVLRHLRRQPWTDGRPAVVAGHSEGSAVVAHLAQEHRLVSQVIYLSGNPLGRMASNIQEERTAANAAQADTLFAYWQQVVAAPQQQACTTGDTNRATYEFSQPLFPGLLKAQMPIWVGYGTLDRGVAGNDFLRLEAIRHKKQHLTFRTYEGREHNFFPLKNGQPDYADFGWDQVADDFLQWLVTPR